MDKLKSKLNYYKEIGCSLNAEEVKKILEELENTQSDLYEANNRINDLLDIEKQKDKIIDEMAIRIFDLQEWIKKQVDYKCFTPYKTVEDIKRIFEERCK